MPAFYKHCVGARRALLFCVRAGVAALCLSWAVACCASDTAAESERTAPSIAAVKVSEPPVIDGALDDACWQQASHIEGFWRTEHDTAEFERTEAWLCYDPRAIYVAFRCHDSEPAKIRATQKKRQGTMGDDDFVSIWLDASNTGSNFYTFRVNPAGTQFDRTPGGTSEKIEWKGDWRAAARVDEGGWSAEIEIPFGILRYPNGQSCFRFDLERRLARQEDTSLWPADFARKFNTDDCARWTGLSTPRVPFRWVAMPYALSVVSEDAEDREPLTAGLDLKGTFPNGVVGLGTFNPDFRNLEDVVETIDFTFVERWLPEYRPFFQEGHWYMPSSTVFYSRRIEDFDWGLKAFGTAGANRFGLLETYRRGGENHLAWDYERMFGTTGVVAVYGAAPRIPDEPSNLAGGILASREWPFEGGARFVNGSWHVSRTAGEGGDDIQCEFHSGQWRRQGLGWSLDYSSVGPEFNAEDGYVPETGVRELSVSLGGRGTYDTGALQNRSWFISSRVGESEDGRRRGVGLGHDWAWRNGVSLWLGLSSGVRDGYDTSDYWVGGQWARNDRYHRGAWDLTWGDKLGFRSFYASLSQCFRINQRWSGEARLEHNRSAELDDDGNIVPPEATHQAVLTATYDITDERSLSSRLVCRNEGTNFYLAYRQRVRKGTDLLIVVGDPNADEWVSRLAMKAIWCY